ncbi:SH3 domain-containing protein [Pseudomonas frederiksbergensis]|uniref:SH3 domain-containing protein n=1 Tax=Pseudomonas frederiksbergensis TaxID=104087 RepID=UPI003D20E168
MAGEKNSEHLPGVGEQVEDSGALITPSFGSGLNAGDPNLYAMPGKKIGQQLSSKAVEKYLSQSMAAQNFLEKTEKLLRPSSAVQAFMDATQRMLLPTIQMQSFLDTAELALFPSREAYAAFAATERLLKPSRELQELATRSEKIARSFAEYGAGSFEVLGKAAQQSQGFKSMIAALDMHSSAASLKSVLGSFENLRISPLFELLSTTDHSHLRTLLDAYDGEEAFSSFGSIPSTSEDVEAEVVRALESSDSPQKLTAPALALLLFLITILYQSYDGISKWNDFRESVCDIEQRFGAFDSLAQARKVVRSALCDVPPALTDSIRLTKKDEVNLREGPGMKEEVILSLPRFARLEVIDSSNRDWLLVVYKHQDIEIEGWVSRKLVRSVSK